MDTVTTVNLVLCIIIVVLAIVVYTNKKSRIALYIGFTFALYGISHILNLTLPGPSLTGVVLIIRIIGYLIIIFALYKLWKP